jgi:magnesium transporter
MSNYKKISKNIQKLVIDNPVTPTNKLTWIDVKDPGKKEIEYLRKQYNFSLAHLQASSAKAVAQRQTIVKSDFYTFMILHFPAYKNDTIVASEIEFFIGVDYLITLHSSNFNALNQFFNYSKKDSNSLKSFQFESSTILLYEIIEKILLDCFTLLDKNSIAISQLEETIFAQKSKKAVSEILLLRRNIINTRRIMQNHKNIIKKLVTVQTGFAPEKTLKTNYNEILDHSKRFWEYLENQKEMIEVLNSTNESLLNYHLSDIMKTLTIFSVIVFPLTLLAAIFGMNTVNSMPFMDSEHGFWIVISIMLLGCVGMIIFFAKKKWL